MRTVTSAHDLSVLYGGLENRLRDGELLEDIIAALYQAILGPDGVAIDGGAHRGRHTFPMASAASRGRVYAFEPQAELARALAVRARRRGVSDRVRVIERALGRTAATADFHVVPNMTGLSALERSLDFADRPTVSRPVEVVKLDDELGDIPRLDFVKLDLEGGEFFAMVGGQALLARTRPVIAFEHGKAGIAKRYGYTCDEFFAFFQSIDYQVFDIFGTEFRPEFWLGRRPWSPYYAVALPREASDARRLVGTVIQETLLSDHILI